MTDFARIVRWNAGLVRGLAERVLNRAKVIRCSLAAPEKVKTKPKNKKSKAQKKRPVARRAKRIDA